MAELNILGLKAAPFLRMVPDTQGITSSPIHPQAAAILLSISQIGHFSLSLFLSLPPPV